MKKTGGIGAKVKYKKWVSTIVKKLPELAIGAVRIDPPILGMRYWNMDELEYVKTNHRG